MRNPYMKFQNPNLKNWMDTHMGGQKAKPKPVYSHFLKFKKQVHLQVYMGWWGAKHFFYRQLFVKSFK